MLKMMYLQKSCILVIKNYIQKSYFFKFDKHKKGTFNPLHKTTKFYYLSFLIFFLNFSIKKLI